MYPSKKSTAVLPAAARRGIRIKIAARLAPRRKQKTSAQQLRRKSKGIEAGTLGVG
jgi:hypothetical protein